MTLETKTLDGYLANLERGAWAAAESFVSGACESMPIRCGTELCDRSCCIGIPYTLVGESQLIAERLSTPIMKPARDRVLAHDGIPSRARCPLQDPRTGLCEVYDIRPFLCRTYLVPSATGPCATDGCDLVDATKLSDMAIRLAYSGSLIENLLMILARHGFRGQGSIALGRRADRQMSANRKQRRRARR